jgi:hypothetical protein
MWGLLTLLVYQSVQWVLNSVARARKNVDGLQGNNAPWSDRELAAPF